MNESLGTSSYLWVWAQSALWLLFGVPVSLLALLYTQQCSLIYPSSLPPGSRKEVAKPSDYGMGSWEDLDISTADGLLIKGYFIPSPSTAKGAKITILYLHANAGNMGHRLPIAHELQSRLVCHIVMLSYRGYGLSPGAPSEKGIKLDAQAALDWIKEHPTLSQTKIILYGQSIGGAVAIHLASQNPSNVHGLIIENTFTSLRQLIPSVMPALRYLTFLCHQRWESKKAITLVKSAPILFLSGRRDELVPPSHMQSLYDEVMSVRTSDGKNSDESKETLRNVHIRSFPAGTHNDTCLQFGYFEEIQTFVKAHFGLPP